MHFENDRLNYSGGFFMSLSGKTRFALKVDVKIGLG
jgi:hypothetical protein